MEEAHQGFVNVGADADVDFTGCSCLPGDDTRDIHIYTPKIHPQACILLVAWTLPPAHTSFTSYRLVLSPVLSPAST